MPRSAAPRSITNDADPDTSDVLTITSIDAGDLAGALTIAPDGRSIEFDPDAAAAVQAMAPDALKTFTFQYTVSDGRGGTDTASAEVTVLAVPNSAPVVDQGIAAQSVNEDTAWSYVVAAAAFADVDGDALTYTTTLADGSALPSWLSFDGTTFTGTPPHDFNGDIDLKVTASDATGERRNGLHPHRQSGQRRACSPQRLGVDD